jgi:hypothetical protein
VPKLRKLPSKFGISEMPAPKPEFEKLEAPKVEPPKLEPLNPEAAKRGPPKFAGEFPENEENDENRVDPGQFVEK